MDAQITVDETGSPVETPELVPPAEEAPVAPLPDYVFKSRDIVEQFAAVFVEHAARRGAVLASARHLDALLVPDTPCAELEVSTASFQAMQRAVPHTTALECARACKVAAAALAASGAADAEAAQADLEAEAATWLLVDRLVQPAVAAREWRAWADARRAALLGGRSVGAVPPRTLREVATVESRAVALETFLVKWLETECCTPAQRRAAEDVVREVEARKRGQRGDECGSVLDADETLVLQQCWLLLRTGHARAAEDLLAQTQPLVGAALCGWAPYDGGERGNPNRRAWGAICAAASRQRERSAHRRAVEGLLAGTVEPALAVCETRADRLWVLARALLDRDTDGYLVSERGYADAQLDEYRKDAPRVASLADVFALLRTLPPLPQHAQAQHATPLAALLDAVQEQLLCADAHAAVALLQPACARALHDAPAAPATARLVRFAAHLALFLRVPAPDLLRAHIACNLVAAPHYDLVAPYITFLPNDPDSDGTDGDAHVREYAQFVHTVVTAPTWAEMAPRARRALTEKMAVTAEQCGIAFAAVVAGLVRLLDADDAARGARPWSPAAERAAAEARVDAVCMRALDTAQCVETLQLANRYARALLLRGDRATAARMLVSDGALDADLLRAVEAHFVHSDSSDGDGDGGAMDDDGADERVRARAAEDAMHEYVCLRGYTEAQDAYEEWAQGRADGARAADMLTNVLTVQNGFLAPTPRDDDDAGAAGAAGAAPTAAEEARRDELERLRCMLVPRVAGELLDVLRARRCFARAAELPALLCDETTGLSDCFDQDALAAFLDKYTETSIAAL